MLLSNLVKVLDLCSKRPKLARLTVNHLQIYNKILLKSSKQLRKRQQNLLTLRNLQLSKSLKSVVCISLAFKNLCLNLKFRK